MPGIRRYVIPLLVVFALVGVVWGVIAVQGLEPRLGLDLRGGSSVTFVPTNPRGGAPTQEEEPAEHEGVRADHPLQVLLGEPQVHLDRGQRHVHDRDVEDHHELDHAQKCQGQPLATVLRHRWSYLHF